MISFDNIDDSLIKGVAKRIQVCAQGKGHDFPYIARYWIVAGPTGVSEGHPHVLMAEAHTPADAIDAVIDMIDTWLSTPRAPWLVRKRGLVRTTSPGLIPDEWSGSRGMR